MNGPENDIFLVSSLWCRPVAVTELQNAFKAHSGLEPLGCRISIGMYPQRPWIIQNIPLYHFNNEI